jgi:hypothetical protein
VSKIDHIEESCGEVRGEQLAAVVVDGEVIEAASERTGQIDRCYLSQCWARIRR